MSIGSTISLENPQFSAESGTEDKSATLEEEESEDGGEPGEDEDEDGSDAELAQEIAQATMAGILAQINASVQPSVPPCLTPIPLDDHLDNDTRVGDGPAMSSSASAGVSENYRRPSSKIITALDTIRNILSLASRNTLVRSMLSNLIIPESEGANVYDTLSNLLESGRIPKEIARCLSPLLMSLATSEFLFPPLPKAAPSDPGKRQRSRSNEPPIAPMKRTATIEQPYSIHLQLDHAVSTIESALESARDAPFTPAFVASIQYPLYHVFLFAATLCADVEIPGAASLLELAALIQLLGVLASVPIGGTPDTGYSTAASWHPPPPIPLADITTAVYTCPFPSCYKVFLRLHAQRKHTRVHEPQLQFACASCTSSFTHSEDLARHALLHDATGAVWRCGVCARIFRSEVAINRHRNHAKEHNILCSDAPAIELESIPARDPFLEDGQVHADTLRYAQAAAARLLSPLRTFVARNVPALAPAIGLDASSEPPSTAPPLAEVMAKALQQFKESMLSGANPSIDLWGIYAPTGLSVEQTRLLGHAITSAISAARRQSEALASVEEEDERDEVNLDNEDIAA